MSNANLEFLTQAFLRHGREAFDMTWHTNMPKWLREAYFNNSNCDDVDYFINRGLLRKCHRGYALTDKAIALIKEQLDEPTNGQ